MYVSYSLSEMAWDIMRKIHCQPVNILKSQDYLVIINDLPFLNNVFKNMCEIFKVLKNWGNKNPKLTPTSQDQGVKRSFCKRLKSICSKQKDSCAEFQYIRSSNSQSISAKHTRKQKTRCAQTVLFSVMAQISRERTSKYLHRRSRSFCFGHIDQNVFIKDLLTP